MDKWRRRGGWVGGKLLLTTESQLIKLEEMMKLENDEIRNLKIIIIIDQS